MLSVKTDVNPSDIGTKALGRDMGTELSEMSFLGADTMEMSDKDVLASRTCGGLDETNDRHM